MPKTALMGSPLAVIGTVFRHRRTLAKTGAAVGGVLMLPMLFLVMLPGLVFGDLSENTGALTSNTVISKNIRASNQAIVEVLQESHDALLAKINAEISRLPEGDTASISDPYASSIIVNANQLIAQFCASQDDYKNINISKLKMNCFPSSRQSKKRKLFLPPDAKNWWQFYAANIYCSCFSNGVNTPRFLCNRFVL